MKISIHSLLGYAQLLDKQQEPSTSHYKAKKMLRSCNWLKEN